MSAAAEPLIPATFNHSAMSRDLANLCLGELLGEGASRRVHLWGPDPKYVIKLEMSCGVFSNVHEEALWQKARGTWLARWLAPVRMISPCGLVLMQERTTEPTSAQLARVKRVPAFFKDVKWENWGFIGKRFVCHDYGYIEFRRSNTERERLVKAPW